MKTALWIILILSCSPLQGQTHPYPVSFTCTSPENPECPYKQPCPVLPPGSRGCGIAPSGVGADQVPPGVWPVGCKVLLPYGNPRRPGQQKQCFCKEESKAKRSWVCPG